ncbi:MAG: 50S ribosomal protein L19 [Planctomycetes bacterium]|jgi:large subunit ribosomal protein L19|nr:50S ribosomal protein L19 [Planctomycetota bacterium]
MNILHTLEIEQMKASIPDFGIGDSVEVHYLIKEGDKERVQLFSGTVISLQGSGVRRSATVRRLVAGEGVERTFPLHSPRVADIQVKERGIIRRAKLYYLRDREGKATRLNPNLGKLQYPRSGKGRAQTTGK